eukprot:70122_1
MSLFFWLSILIFHNAHARKYTKNALIQQDSDYLYELYRLDRFLTRLEDQYDTEDTVSPPKRPRRGKRTHDKRWHELQQKRQQQLKKDIEEPKKEEKEVLTPEEKEEDEKEDAMIKGLLREYEKTHVQQPPPHKHISIHNIFRRASVSKQEVGVDVTKNVEDEQEFIGLSGDFITWLVNDYKGSALFNSLKKGVRVTSVAVKEAGRVLMIPMVVINRQFVTYAMTMVTNLMTDYIGGSMVLFKEKFTTSLNTLFNAIATKTEAMRGRLSKFVPQFVKNGMSWFVTKIEAAVEKTMKFVFRGFEKMFKMVMVYGVRKFQEVIGLRFHAEITPYEFTDEAYQKIKETHAALKDRENESLQEKMKNAMGRGIRKRAFKMAVDAANEGMKMVEHCVKGYLRHKYLESVQGMVDKAPKYKEWLREKIKDVFEMFLKMAFDVIKAVFNHAKHALATAKGVNYDPETMNVARIAYFNRLDQIFSE